MPLTKIVLWGYYCYRCGHRWVPRGFKQPERGKVPRKSDDPGKKPEEPSEEPEVCPFCKSPYWNKPRQDA